MTKDDKSPQNKKVLYGRVGIIAFIIIVVLLIIVIGKKGKFLQKPVNDGIYTDDGTGRATRNTEVDINNMVNSFNQMQDQLLDIKGSGTFGKEETETLINNIANKTEDLVEYTDKNNLLQKQTR